MNQEETHTPLMSRYEVSKVIGIRSMQLAEGNTPKVFVSDEKLACDCVYVAALELYERKLDMRVRRGDGYHFDVSDAHHPRMLRVLLDTRDGGSREK